MQKTIGYSLKTERDLPFAKAVERVRETLAQEGFGVLTEIDVTETLKRKLDVSFRPYVILGACNPPLAHRAPEADLDIGLLLPCNVVVYASEDPGRSIVAAIDPVVQLGVTQRNDLEPLALEVREKLERAISKI